MKDFKEENKIEVKNQMNIVLKNKDQKEENKEPKDLVIEEKRIETKILKEERDNLEDVMNKIMKVNKNKEEIMEEEDITHPNQLQNNSSID